MKQIVVISGKGGTGKTMLTASLAVLANNKVMVDCDVDAADLHILLKPEIKERQEFRSGLTARIDKNICQECGECVSVCRFDAIKDNFIIDPISCEGCKVCSYICPANAIIMEENISGELFISGTKYGTFVHAKLGVAEENSGKLVTKVRQIAKEIAEREKLDYVIIDGPPGIGCPVIASLTGVDIAIIVTEPTLSGLHDMERVTELSKHFGIPTKVVINKYDLNLDNCKIIKNFCECKGIQIIAQFPFSEKVIQSIVNCVPLTEFCNDRIVAEIVNFWENIK